MASKVLEVEFRGKDAGVVAALKAQGASADQVKAKLKELQAASSSAGARVAAAGAAAQVKAAAGIATDGEPRGAAGPLAARGEGSSSRAAGRGGGGRGGGADEGGLRGTIKGLKQGLGEESGVGGLGKILAGGGAVIGLTLLASKLGEAAKGLKDLKQQYDAGQISAGAFAEKIGESIPVIGSFWSAGRQVKDLLASFDGVAHSGFGHLIGLDELNDAEKINKAEAARKVVLDQVDGALQRQKKSLREIADVTRQQATRGGKAFLEGFAADVYDQDAGESDRLAALRAKRQGEVDAADQSQKESIAKVAELPPEARGNAEAQITKQHRQEVARINRAYDQAEANEANVYADERIAFVGRRQKQTQDLVEKYDRDTGGMQAQAQADRLRVLGFGLTAELMLIDRGAAEKRAAIQRDLQEQLKTAAAGMEGQLAAAAERQQAEVDAQAKAQKQNTIGGALQDEQSRILQIRANAGDASAAAELRGVEAARQYTDESNRLLAILKDQSATIEQQRAASQDLAKLQAARRESVDLELRDQAQGFAEQQATYGGTGKERLEAKKEAERIKLQKAMEQRQAATQAILNDPLATAEQKQQARENLTKYTATLGRQYDQDVYGPQTDTKHTANLEERGLLLTGVAAAAKEQHDPNEAVAKNTAEANKLQEKFNQQFTEFLRTYQQSAAQAVPVVVGLGQ